MQQRTNRNYKQEPKRELTPEDQFEEMISKWKKESKDRLNDIKKIQNRKTPDERYKLSLSRFNGGNNQ